MTVGAFVDKLNTKKSAIVRWMDNDGEFHGIDVRSVKDMNFDKVNDIDLLYNDFLDKFYINLNVDKKYIDEYMGK